MTYDPIRRKLLTNIANRESDMEYSKRFTALIAILSFLAVIILIVSHFSDSDFWGARIASAASDPLFYILAAIGVVALAVLPFSTGKHQHSSGNPHRQLPVVLTLAVLGGVVAILSGGGGFFWRNIFDGLLSPFGSFSALAEVYADLPANSGVVNLWDNNVVSSIISAVLCAVYIYLLWLLVTEVIEEKSKRLWSFLFACTTGLIAVFASANDFAVLLVLFALNSYLVLRFLRKELHIGILGVVFIISLVYHPALLLLVLALVPVILAQTKVGRAEWISRVSLIVIPIVAGLGLSLLHTFPFTSVLIPSSSASPSFGIVQLEGFVNQLFMVSHFIWLVALMTFLYMVFTSRVKDAIGMVLGSWFFSALVFYILSYSAYGWIMGFPGAATVVFPAVLWLVYFAGSMDQSAMKRTAVFLIVPNVLVAVFLLLTINSTERAAQLFGKAVAAENAFDAKFKDGKTALMYGIMLSDEFEDYKAAKSVIEPYHWRYPLDPVARYHLGWALTNIPTDLSKGIHLFRQVEEYLLDTHGKTFWEFDKRFGMKYYDGNNAQQAWVRLERAGREMLTEDVALYLALVYRRLKVWDSTASKYIQLIGLGDSTSENFYRVAEAAELANDPETAAEYYWHGIERYPEDVRNYQFIARQYFLNGMYDSLEILATNGMKYSARSPELEACMILVYHYTEREQQRDSMYDAFLDYFQTYPNALYDWGVFLEESGLVYQGRKMQAADVTIEWPNLKAILNFYHYYRDSNSPDSARIIVDRALQMDTSQVIQRVLSKVQEYDDSLWPK